MVWSFGVDVWLSPRRCPATSRRTTSHCAGADCMQLNICTETTAESLKRRLSRRRSASKQIAACEPRQQQQLHVNTLVVSQAAVLKFVAVLTC